MAFHPYAYPFDRTPVYPYAQPYPPQHYGIYPPGGGYHSGHGMGLHTGGHLWGHSFGVHAGGHFGLKGTGVHAGGHLGDYSTGVHAGTNISSKGAGMHIGGNLGSYAGELGVNVGGRKPQVPTGNAWHGYHSAQQD
ncbi:hypothetical protein [Paenibacillus xerothermodurans]|uniref:Uncharacterized protein n=1 Tax=Paenibacillus xerothermodurans TaxID=1977292 RepID=A0A2W1NJG3_PAEXE|nr:hypothetical protein [Paenibacillus xerothermodurans]PZE19665.1 hypothetical protein CBW46_017130 [Paenibacillus xerothermodurans]